MTGLRLTSKRPSLVPSAALLATAALLTAGCGTSEPEPPPDPGDPSSALFAPDHIVEVEIEIAEADWDILRFQTRDIFEMLSGEECLSEPITLPRPYTYFPATVTIDGERRENVGLRKKGLLGSQSDTRPSLKVKLDEYVPGQTAFGLERITLNNSKQDPSYIRTCMAYKMFADAGIPAPRCNFAHVTINGTDMGVFLNVESVKKRFLRRHFADDEGSLYEGTLSDFAPDWVGSFERKTNEENLDRSDLDAVVSAALVANGDLRTALESVIDLEQFMTFWAMEVVTSHIDGYTGNRNNFFVYNDPTTGLFNFMPWGADGVLGNFPGAEAPVLTSGMLAYRLYSDPDTHDLYEAEVRRVLSEIWDTPALLAEIDRMEALITPIAEATDGPGTLAPLIEGVRTFIMNRPAELLTVLDSGTLPPAEEPGEPPCMNVIGEVSGTFATTFDTLDAADPFAAGTGTVTAILDTGTTSYDPVASSTGYDPESPDQSMVQIRVIAVRPDGGWEALIFTVPAQLVADGADINVGFGEAGWGIWYDPQTETMVGFLFGTLHLSMASNTPGAEVSGSFTAEAVAL